MSLDVLVDVNFVIYSCLIPGCSATISTYGSTCTFSESILGSCGFHTGLFTSPHLMDVRERFQLDGENFEVLLVVLEQVEAYFRFLALLAFKIFSAEQVDVAILEVGLGGKFDATNVVVSSRECPVVSKYKASVRT
eukprot:XP_008661510.1 ras-related protein RABH1b isoform X5 [Zea mays]